MKLLSPARALGFSLPASALFAMTNAIWMWLAWTPRLVGDSARVGVACAVLLALVWAATARPSVAAGGAFVTSLSLSVGLLVGFVLPSPGRMAWCSTPGNYCEDGLLVVVAPVLGVMLGAVTALAAAGLAALVRLRAQPSESFRSLSSR